MKSPSCWSAKRRSSWWKASWIGFSKPEPAANNPCSVSSTHSTAPSNLPRTGRAAQCGRTQSCRGQRRWPGPNAVRPYLGYEAREESRRQDRPILSPDRVYRRSSTSTSACVAFPSQPGVTMPPTDFCSSSRIHEKLSVIVVRSPLSVRRGQPAAAKA